MSGATKRNALVFGGSGGIGSAIVETLHAAGYSVHFTFGRNQEAADALQSRCAGAVAIQVDLNDSESIAACVATAAVAADSPKPHLDLLVWAAGPTVDQVYFADLSKEQWRRSMRIETDAMFEATQCAIPALRAASGNLVAISSSGIRRYPPRDLLSVAPKAAIEAIVRAVAREEGRNGVRANSVAVGVVDAGMFQRLKDSGDLDERWLAAARAAIPLRRFGSADDVAQAVLYFAGAGYVSGQTLSVDGGYTV